MGSSPFLTSIHAQDEVRALLATMPPAFLLPAQLAYGSGLRLMAVVRLPMSFNSGFRSP